MNFFPMPVRLPRLLLSLLILSLAAAGGLARAGEKLVIGFSTHKPPYVFEPERKGLEVDIVTAALQQAGYEVKAEFMPMERLHRLLNDRQLDGIATTNAASGITAHYSKPYIEYHNVAVALASRQLRINSIADLSAYSISSFQRARKLLGPAFEAMATLNPNYREEANQVTRNLLLYSGRVEVVVGDRRIIEHLRKEVADRVNVEQALDLFPLFPPTPYSVGFIEAQTQRRFDQGLDQIRRNGAYAAILSRYE